jgi:hypothetical protein
MHNKILTATRRVRRILGYSCIECGAPLGSGSQGHLCGHCASR